MLVFTMAGFVRLHLTHSIAPRPIGGSAVWVATTGEGLP